MIDSKKNISDSPLVGILVEPYSKFGANLEVYEKILKYNNIQHVRLDINQADFWEVVQKLDLFILRGRVRQDQKERIETILPIIEKQYGISCYPNTGTYWPYDDKLKEYYLMKSAGFPMTKSWIFWDRKKALNWLKKASFPLIFKLKGGAGSSNVILLKNRRQAKRLTKRMFGKGISSSRIPSFNRLNIKSFDIKQQTRKLGGNLLRKIRHEDIKKYWSREKNYVIFQKFLPNNEFDTRVTTIGKRAFAFRRFNRTNDFRSSGSGKFDFDPEKINLDFVKLALEISEHFGFQSMAYDFLYNESGEPEFCEISYIFMEEIIENAKGYWDKDLNWHEGKQLMQYYILKDELGYPDLKMPASSKE